MNYDILEEILGKIEPLDRFRYCEILCVKPKFTQYELAKDILSRKNIKSRMGALLRASHTGELELYKEALGHNLNRQLFPGYAGNFDIYEFLSKYDIEERPRRFILLVLSARWQGLLN